MEDFEKNIINDYVTQQISTHTLAAKYHIGTIKVRQILSDANVERRKRGGQKKDRKEFVYDYNQPKYKPREGYQFVCRPKDGSDFQTTDYLNKSGCITNYISSRYVVKIPSLRERREYYERTGNYWWEEYFSCTEEKIVERPSICCPICGWKTFDINNESGSLTIHLRDKHNLTVEEYLKEHPHDRNLFPKHAQALEKKILMENEANHIICPLCGKKMRSLTLSHLKYCHGIDMREFKAKFPDFDVLSRSMYEKVTEIQCLANKAPRKKHSYISKQEMEIREFLDNNGIAYETNRQILEGKEIDILIPSKRIGIEIDGLKWHSEFFGKKGPKYHIGKTELANRHGYGLIHIFEDEIVNQKEIVLDKLSHILWLHVHLERVYARKVQVKEISIEQANEIFAKYHLKGVIDSGTCVGGFYGGKLVGAMSLQNMHHDEWLITRCATKTDRIYVGLVGKLFHHFVKLHNPSKVTSFCDRRWTIDSDSSVYAKIGFKHIGAVEPSFDYYNCNKGRYVRIPPSESDKAENMLNLGYDRIWNCGKFEYVWTPICVS